jgi:hypothetical protein
MDGALNKLIAHIAAGGPGVGWLLAAYLLFRLHQVVDRQHKANLETVEVLAIIKTLLTARLNTGGD